MKRLEVLAGATYDGIDDRELPMSVDGVPRVLEVDHLVLCTCQEPLWELLGPLKAAGAALQLLGVPRRGAAELDAQCAISQAPRLAAEIEGVVPGEEPA